MDYGNIPKKFQQIPVHSFQEISLHHLQPFLVFSRDLCIHRPKFFYGEVHNDDGNMLKMFHLNIVYRLGDKDKTSHCPVNL